MVGFGVLMPVLPFYTERMVNAEGISPDKIAIHVGLLTSAYPMSQLIPVIFLGKLSDRIGRKPLLVLGLTGFVLMLFFTAMAAT
jgi:DHA1 family multidrug resistance protein-like MFS transporter